MHALKRRRTQNELLFGADFGFRGIIGQFFFKNKQVETVTVNGNRYRAILKEFLFTKIEKEDIGNIWFQQDAVMCHTAEATLDVLRSVFEDRIISRRVDVVWHFRAKIKEEEDTGNISFQQDGATCHKAEVTLDVLRPVFKDPIISRRADVV